MTSSSRIYKIHHQCLSHNHKFDIDNDNGEKLYIVHSSPQPLSGQLSLCEASTGKELIRISEESHYLHITYDIAGVTTDANNAKHFATVKKIHGQHHFHKTFEIDSIYGVYKVERIGGLFGHEIKLTTGNNTVVDVTKHADLYHVEVNDDDGGDVFLLAIVIALWRAQRWHHL
jgi:uncharacterized protein YxjI